MCFSRQRRAIFRHRNFKKCSETVSFLTFCFSRQRRAIFRHLNFKKCSEPDVFCTFWLQNILLATAACNFSTSELQKVLRTWRVLYILTSKCASRDSGVQFFDIWTSKSAPNLTCFVHFDFKIYFSPQRRAIFRHLNFKKCSEPDVFCTFWLQNVLLATTACNFWFLLWPHDSAPAALTSLLFDSPDTRIIGKTQHFATSLTFGAGESSFFWLSRYCIFFLLTLLHLLTFFWLYFIYLLFICFSTLHIVGSLLFKFPPIIQRYMQCVSMYIYLRTDVIWIHAVCFYVYLGTDVIWMLHVTWSDVLQFVWALGALV